jgi:hypothetical protein
MVCIGAQAALPFSFRLCRPSTVLRFWRMGHTLTVRLTAELARWLEETSKRSGVPQGEIVRAQLERARSERKARPHMRLAGCVDGPGDLSARKGFSKG